MSLQSKASVGASVDEYSLLVPEKLELDHLAMLSTVQNGCIYVALVADFQEAAYELGNKVDLQLKEKQQLLIEVGIMISEM